MYNEVTQCVDYNSPINANDCEHDHRYFVGSDCSLSMSWGLCWNELM